MAQWGKSTLWDAAADGDLEMVKKRLSTQAAKINAQDAQGKTPLHEASRWGHLEVVKYLIAQGAKIDITTKEGTTILHLASLNGHNNLIEYLVKEAKHPINVKDKYGDTPLMAASGAAKVSTVRLLLDLGADKTIVNNNKRSAVDLAATPDTSAVFKEEKYVSPTKY